MSSDMEDLFQLGRRSAEDVEDAGQAEEKEEEKHIEGPAPHLVEAFCVALSRLELGQRLYAADNKLLVLMLERVAESWKLITANGEGISLDLTENALSYHDIIVFQQEGRDTIASRLYQDGIRRLTFTGTMDVDEAVRLLTIFDKNQAWQHEADLADRLWILDLKGVRYQAVDGFDELVKETRGAAMKQSAAALSQLSGQQGTLTQMTAKGGGAPTMAGIGGVGGGGGGGGGGSRQMAKAEKDWGPTRRFDVDPDGIRHLQMEIDNEGESDEEFWVEGRSQATQTFAHFHEMMAYVIEEEGVGLGDAKVDNLLENMFREQLALDDGDMAGSIEASFLRPEPVGSTMKRAWHKVVEPKLFTDLLSESRAGSTRQKALTYLMEKYLQPSPEDLVSAVVANPVLEAAESLIEMLHTTEEEPLKFWIAHLDKLPISILKDITARLDEPQLEKDSGAAFLKHLWASPDPDMSVIAADITPREQLAPHRETLLERLEDPVQEVRLSSSSALRRLGDAKSGIYVLNLLRHTAEKRLTEAEIRSLLHTLMDLGGDRYVPYLGQCLGPLVKPKKGFFGVSTKRRGPGAHINPLGDKQVLRALARHGTPQAMDLLKEAFNNGEPEIKTFIGAIRMDPEVDESAAMKQAPAPPRARPGAADAEKGFEAAGDDEEKPLASGKGLLRNLSGFMRRKS